MTNKEIISRIYPVIKPYRGKLVLAMIGMIIVAGLQAAQAWIVKDVVDDIFVNKDETLLKILPIALIVLFTVKGIFYFIYSYALEGVGQSVIRDLRDKIYVHIHSLSLDFFYKNSTGSLTSRIINDVALLQGAVSNALIRILKDAVSAVGLLIVVFYMDWRLALLSFVFLPLAFTPIVYFGRRFRQIGTDYQETLGETSGILHETIAGAKIVKAFCMEHYERVRFGK